MDDEIDELKKIIPNLSDFYDYNGNDYEFKGDEFNDYIEGLSVEKLYDILDVKLSYCTGEANCVTCKNGF